MLGVLDRIRKRTPARSQADINREIAQIRAARKAGGRRRASR
jgi:hypothetical protein